VSLRRSVTALAAGLVLATAPAAAQSQATEFWFDNAGPLNTSYDFYQGSFDGSDYFQIFCVHPTQYVSDPDHYNAWITPFTAADGSLAENVHQTWGPGRYREAAQLASLMLGNSTSHLLDASQVVQLQKAIWYAMGFTSYGTVGNYNNWLAQASGIVIDDSEWFVITGNEQTGHGSKQEFISFRPSPPQETVPEPATMTLLATGLAGMAAARRRRKS
jgi:hypothetical protein